jgi:hypothetical protein
MHKMSLTEYDQRMRRCVRRNNNCKIWIFHKRVTYNLNLHTMSTESHEDTTTVSFQCQLISLFSWLIKAEWDLLWPRSILFNGAANCWSCITSAADNRTDGMRLRRETRSGKSYVLWNGANRHKEIVVYFKYHLCSVVCMRHGNCLQNVI